MESSDFHAFWTLFCYILLTTLYNTSHVTNENRGFERKHHLPNGTLLGSKAPEMAPEGSDSRAWAWSDVAKDVLTASWETSVVAYRRVWLSFSGLLTGELPGLHGEVVNTPSFELGQIQLT